MSDGHAISLAVWDWPMPVVAGERFPIKVGAKAADGRALTGRRVEISDARDAVVASGALGETRLSGTEALYWLELDVPAPLTPLVAKYNVRLIADAGAPEAVAAQFSVAAAAKPEHIVAVCVTDRDSSQALAEVEVRLGPFQARTDQSGRAALRLCKGDFHVQLWRTGYIAAPQPLTIDGDRRLELTMAHVPEEHPDARWVR